MSTIYDSIIIGGGPAGLCALLYMGRGLTNSLLIEKKGIGGLVSSTEHIENYLGFKSIDSFDLIEKMKEHALEFAKDSIRYDEVESISDFDKEIKTIKTSDGDEYKTKSIILSLGTTTRSINVTGEEKFVGRGVSYCATCDGAFYKDLEIALVGGGNSAFDEAIFLTRFVKKIYLVHRRKEFRASEVLVQRLKDTGKVEFVLDSVIEEIVGDNKVSSIKIKNIISNEVIEKNISGVFVFVGQNPSTSLIENTPIKLNNEKYIIADMNMHTSVDGIFACGDVIEKNVRQIANAVGDGAIAASESIKYIQSL